MEEELALCSEVREKGAARACRREGRMGLVAGFLCAWKGGRQGWKDGDMARAGTDLAFY